MARPIPASSPSPIQASAAPNHITAVAIAKQLGIQWKNMPYKGGAAASRAVVSGESDVIINGAAGDDALRGEQQLVGLAVSGEQRHCVGPRSADLQGAGLPVVDAGTWQGILTTGGTPPAMVARLNAEISKILAMPETSAEDRRAGRRREGPIHRRSSATGSRMPRPDWGTIIQEAGIKGS